MPHTFWDHVSSEQLMPAEPSYLKDLDNNKQVIILEIDLMSRTHDTGDKLYDAVSRHLVVISQGRSDGKLDGICQLYDVSGSSDSPTLRG